MTKRLLIFDLDGTLYQTHTPLIPAVIHTFHLHHLPIPSEQAIMDNIRYPTERFIQCLAPNIDAIVIEAVAETLHQQERASILSHGQLFDGLYDLLHTLVDSGYTLAICSNGSDEYIRTILDHQGITHLFTTIRGCSVLCKSDRIASMVREIHPEHAIVIGDTQEDILAARDNHLISIGADYGYGEVDDADFIATDAATLNQNILLIDIYHEIHTLIKARKKPNTSYIVGINGVDTSGKTTFCHSFATYLGALGCKTQIIHMDDFHNPHAIRSQNPDAIRSYIDHAFDLDKLTSELLHPIAQGKAIHKTLTLLDLDNDTYTNECYYDIDEDTIVLLEGVLLFRPPIEDYCDTKVFMDISFDTVLERATVRDVPKYGLAFLDRYREKYIPIQKAYLKAHNPIAKSDIIINNNDYMHPTIRRNLLIHEKDSETHRHSATGAYHHNHHGCGCPVLQ